MHTTLSLHSALVVHDFPASAPPVPPLPPVPPVPPLPPLPPSGLQLAPPFTQKCERQQKPAAMSQSPLFRHS